MSDLKYILNVPRKVATQIEWELSTMIMGGRGQYSVKLNRARTVFGARFHHPKSHPRKLRYGYKASDSDLDCLLEALVSPLGQKDLARKIYLDVKKQGYVAPEGE